MDFDLGAVMVPGGWQNRTLVLPDPTPTPPMEVGVFPLARRDFRHVRGGEVRVAVARYGDIHAFAWYVGGGWLTLNRGRRLRTRSHHGVEDGRKRQG